MEALSVSVVFVDGSPVAAFTDEHLLSAMLNRSKAASVRSIPLDPDVDAEAKPKAPVWSVVTVSRYLDLHDLYTATQPPGVEWQIVNHGGELRVFKEVVPGPGAEYEISANALRLAMHLVDAGIWLNQDQWAPWFESIAREVRDQMSLWYRPKSGQPGDFSVSVSGSVLDVSTDNDVFHFGLYPDSSHPNGDATVKWIMREIEKRHSGA